MPYRYAKLPFHGPKGKHSISDTTAFMFPATRRDLLRTVRQPASRTTRKRRPFGGPEDTDDDPPVQRFGRRRRGKVPSMRAAPYPASPKQPQQQLAPRTGMENALRSTMAAPLPASPAEVGGEGTTEVPSRHRVRIRGGAGPSRHRESEAQIYDEVSAQESIAPLWMDRTVLGELTPWFKYKMSSRYTRKSFRPTPDVVEYYTKGAVDFDRVGVTTHLFNRDGMLRRDADARERGEDLVGPPWEFIRFLGKGGFGSVTEWRQEYPGNDTVSVAIKDSKGQNFWQDYNNEYNMIRRLNLIKCPTVIEAYDSIMYMVPHDHDIIRPGFRLALEYCTGGALSDVKKFYAKHHLAIPESFIWHVALGIATALLYMKNGGLTQEKVTMWETIMHEDIKLHNTLLQRDGESSNLIYPAVKVADFGLAYAVPNESVAMFKAAWNKTGTTQYRDPAKVNRGEYGWKPADPVTDIYSFGATLRELMIPFESRMFGEQRSVWSLARDIMWNRDYLLEKDPAQYQMYSTDLVMYVTQCMATRESRPDTWQLYNVALNKRNEFEQDLQDAKARADRLDEPWYEGCVVIGEKMRNQFLNDDEFQTKVRALDWLTIHKDLVDDMGDALEMAVEEDEAGCNSNRDVIPTIE